jgi:hypothetical protein
MESRRKGGNKQSLFSRDYYWGNNQIVVTAVGIAAAYTGNALPVIAAGEKMFADRSDPFEAELPVCIGILFIISTEEIGKMPLEDSVKGVSSPRKVLRLLVFLY